MLSRPVAGLIVLALLGCTPEAPPSPVAKEPPATAPRPPDLSLDGAASGPKPRAPSGPSAEPSPPVTAPPVVSSAAPASSAVPPAASSAAPPAPKLTIIELAPTQGDLTPLLRDEAKRAKEKGLIAVVEFYADWCAPCRVFQRSIREPEIAGPLAGVHLVKLNLDDWHDKLQGTGFAPRTIPSFYFFGADGRPKGKMLDGDKWGKSSPARMGEALAEFLHGSADAGRP
ncbi:MAG: thioredoxin family protein [Minicystis sp.]